MSFSPDGLSLVTVSRDRTWCLYLRKNNVFERVAGTDKKNSVHQRLIWACGWSPDSKSFVTCSRDKKVAVWSAESGALACKKPLVLEDSVTAVAFAPLGSGAHYVLAAGQEDGRVLVIFWDPAKDEDGEWGIMHSERVHHKTVKKLSFRPRPHNGGDLVLASCSSDHSVKLFKVRHAS
jgi:elongator complex protein 2